MSNKNDTAELSAEEIERELEVASFNEIVRPAYGEADQAYLDSETSTEEETSAAVDRQEARGSVVGSDALGALAPGYVALAEKQAPWNGSAMALDLLSHRPDVIGATPAEHAAWSAVDAAVEVLAEARMSVSLLVADQSDEQKGHDRKVADALRAGKALPKLTTTDWTSESRVRRAKVVIAGEELQAARKAFDQVSAAETPKRFTQAAERLKAARAKAEELVGPALSAFETYRAAVDSMTALAAPEVREWSGRAGLTASEREMLAGAAQAPGAIRSVMASECPSITGRYQSGEEGDKLVPPTWAREAIWRDGTQYLASVLRDAEIRERFQHTQLMLQEAIACGLVGPELQGYLREQGNPSLQQ